MKLEQKKIEFLKTILDSVLSLPYEKEIPKLDIRKLSYLIVGLIVVITHLMIFLITLMKGI